MSLDNNNGGSMVSAILGDLDKPAAPVNHNTDTAIDESQDLLLVANEDEVEIDDSFSLDGFQVVRREFFAHTFEPSISMQDNKIGFNTAAIRKMPDTDYVQFLINSDSRTLVIMPCTENAPDSLMWCSTSKGKRKPRHVSGRFFFLKLAALMEWNPDNRYKILGKLIRSNGQNLFVFKLDDVEQYKREKTTGKATRTPSYPSDWQNQFGVPYEDHKASLQINLLDGFAVMGIKEKVKEAVVGDGDQLSIEDGTGLVPATLEGGGTHE